MNVPKAKTAPERGGGGKWKFSDLLADAEIRERWEKVRRYFFLRESTYDMTNRCNIRCEGCYYYEGEKQFARENGDPELWRRLMRDEKGRGINVAEIDVDEIFRTDADPSERWLSDFLMAGMSMPKRVAQGRVIPRLKLLWLALAITNPAQAELVIR